MTSQLSPQAAAGLRRALEIHQGKRPNTVTVKKSAEEQVLTLPEIGEKTGELARTGKLVVDPANVKNARYSTQAAKDLILFHYDFVGLHVGRAINFVGEYQAARTNPDAFPLFRLMLDRPLFSGGGSGTMDRSILATRPTQVGRVFAEMFIEQATFTQRYSKKERDDFKRKTNRVLKDQFWRVRRWDLSLPDYNKFALFLPSGLDYSLIPFVRPDGIIDVRQTDPEEVVMQMGYRTLMNGHAVDLM